VTDHQTGGTLKASDARGDDGTCAQARVALAGLPLLGQTRNRFSGNRSTVAPHPLERSTSVKVGATYIRFYRPVPVGAPDIRRRPRRGRTSDQSKLGITGTDLLVNQASEC
jgi:hypothetical protein